MGYDIKSLVADWDWTYPVYRYVIEDPAPTWMRDARSGNDLAFPWAQHPGGVLIAEGIDAPGDTTPAWSGTHEVKDGGELIAAATRFDPDDNDGLLQFVNRWGLLGLNSDPGAAPFWDSVFETRTHLKTLQRRLRRLDALKHGRWQSGALLSVTEIRKELPGFPKSPSPRERQRGHWQAFAQDLNTALAKCRLRAALIPAPGVPGLRQTLLPQHLADVLLVMLWQNATAGDLLPRKCDICSGMFFVSATNHKRLYCSTRCKNLAGVRRWRKQSERKRRK